jgi:hypothetical protein
MSEEALKDGVIQQRFAVVRYPALTLLESQMWKVMNPCVIMHNIIIERKCDTTLDDDQPFNYQETLAAIEHLPQEFTAFLHTHQKIRDAGGHAQL